ANTVRGDEPYTPESEYRVDPVEFSLNKVRETEQEHERRPQNVNTIKPKPAESEPPVAEAPAKNETAPDFTVEEPSQRTEVKNELKTPALTVETIKEEKPSTADELVEKVGQYDPKLDLSGYQYPTLDLLRDYGSGKITVNNNELEANKDKIVETLGNYNIEISKIKATIGPTVTLYEIIPKPGVRI